MSYTLEALIGKTSALKVLQQHYAHAHAIALDQDFSLIPMTEELFDEINKNSIAPAIDKFCYLNSVVEQKVVDLVEEEPVGYLEADFFDGQGGQLAVLWQNKCRKNFYKFGPHAIDALLQDLGVIAKQGQDEFDTLGLGRHRKTADWLVE